MTIIFRATTELLDTVRHDLHRDHAFAAERVGFLTCRAGRLGSGGLLVLAAGYEAVADEHYLRDDRVGAMMGPSAIRQAMQLAYNHGAEDVSIFHVHMHGHAGLPGFSTVDITESLKFAPDFFTLAPRMPHGVLVLSRDQAIGLCWQAQHEQPALFDRFESVGAPMRAWRGAHDKSKTC